MFRLIRLPLTSTRPRFSRSISTAPKIIAIRREDKSVWERRVALTPDAISDIIKQTGTTVYVQPSNNRIFNDEKYVEAGAIIQEDVSPADIIIGIKEVPTRNLIPNKTYVFFSHTTKGQPYNMAMLKDILDKRIRLIDYELMTNDDRKRLVLFGTHAGYAGMIDGLHGLGLRLLGLGYNTPFMHIGMSHTYDTLSSARSAVRAVGDTITKDGLPSEVGPMTFVFTGSGNVAKGAQDIFRELPHEYVEAKDLKSIVSGKYGRSRRLYACHVKLEDYLRRKDTDKFESKSDYYANPDKYISTFHTEISPYTTMLIHGSYWDARYPRLLTTEHLRSIQADSNNKHRLLSIADISCDIKGSLEFTSHSTTIDDPFYYVDSIAGEEHKDMARNGTQIMAVDILPTEIPLESSQHFSKAFYPFILELIQKHAITNPVLKRATIAEDGSLTPAYNHLYDKLQGIEQEKKVQQHNEKRKRVLVLGSGFVAKPLVDYLNKLEGVDITVASNTKLEASTLVKGLDGIEVAELDVRDIGRMKTLVDSCDVVVSFVPAPLHPSIAKICIEMKKHMVTASYISPAMRDLDEKAKEAGIAILNEIGLDPGIDHLSTMKVIDEVKSGGGEITSFISWCGGLPAPEYSNLPLSYKFSWSPRGVLTAALNDARFWMMGKVHNIPGSDLLKNHFPNVPIYNGFAFEGLANRDSLTYVDTYGLAPIENKQAMFRGTLRYKGFSDLMYSFVNIGLLDSSEMTRQIDNWTDFLDYLLFDKSNVNNPNNESRIDAIADKLKLSKDHEMLENVIDTLTWLSLFPTSSSSTQASSFPNVKTPIDAFCFLLQNKLAYNKGETDLVVLHHEFGVKNKQGLEEIRTSTLVEYGTPGGYTAMARTVGLPAAMAVEMILRDKIKECGVLSPTSPYIYKTILENLDSQGVRIIENTRIRGMASSLSWSGSGIWEC